MKNSNSCVSPEFKPSNKTCDKFEISECGAFSKAFELGYGNKLLRLYNLWSDVSGLVGDYLSKLIEKGSNV